MNVGGCMFVCVGVRGCMWVCVGVRVRVYVYVGVRRMWVYVGVCGCKVSRDLCGGAQFHVQPPQVEFAVTLQ